MPRVYSKATWYAARIAAMSPREALFRVDERRRMVAARWLRHASAPPPSPTWLESAPLRDFSLAAGDAAGSANEQPAGAVQPGRAGGRYPDWHRDPATGAEWPQGLALGVDYRHDADRLGDVKPIWDLNRLQFALPLAIDAYER